MNEECTMTYQLEDTVVEIYGELNVELLSYEIYKLFNKKAIDIYE